MATKPKTPKKDATNITYSGKTQSLVDWRKELNLERKEVEGRLKLWKEEVITTQELLAPTGEVKEKLSQKGISIGAPGQLGPRKAAMEALFQAFALYGLPKLPEEMKDYMNSGVTGPVLDFYLRFQKFFPTQQMEQLDGEQPVKAQVAVIFQAAAPKAGEYTVLDI